jgi:hypothetical protein
VQVAYSPHFARLKSMEIQAENKFSRIFKPAPKTLRPFNETLQQLRSADGIEEAVSKIKSSPMV